MFSVLIMAGVWWCAVVAHFLVCGICAYMVGNPAEVPFWLRPWDELFQYGISGFLSLLLMLVWWVIVAIVFMPFAFVALYIGRGLFAVAGSADRSADKAAERDDAYWHGLGVMTPVLIMALLSLLILPVQAPHHIDSESGLETAEQVSYAAFAEYQFLSMFAMFVILALFGTLFGGAAVVATYMPDAGMVVFFLLIFFSIAVAIGLGLGIGPIVGELPHRYGVYQATAIAFAFLALLTGPPILLSLRGGKKGPASV
ncbi:MAG: hypothetical protein C0483_02215 [Pirellula sp.]|nr:hypothetical protein [Pirellula sp.]